MTTKKHKKSYSSVYRIYRRIRFIRYKKRLKKRLEKKLLLQNEQEQEEIREKLLSYRKSEKEQLRLKRKADKKEARKLKEELKKEFLERKALAKEEWDKLSREDQERLKAQKELEREERLNQVKLERARRKEDLRKAVRSLNIRNLLKAYRDNAPKRRLFFIIAANSTVLFLLSYLALFLIYQGVTVISGRFFDYPMIIYYWEIYFNISPEAWYHDSVRTIFSSGPLILFILGVISLIIYSNIRDFTGNFKLFFLWSYLQGVNMLFGALLIGTLFETGVGHVISWMYIMDTGKVLYSTISIFILVISGIIAIKSFLISGNAYFNEMTRENRGFLIRSQVLFPYIIGNVILILIRQPRFMFYETFTSIILIISLLPALVAVGSSHDLFFDEDVKKPAFRWFPFFYLVVIIILYRGILQIGVRVGD